MINPIKSKGRILFVIDGCHICNIWKSFVHRFNLKLKPEKRIKIIDCTRYDSYGVEDNPIIKLFEKEIDGYPVLFLEGSRKDGANSLIECQAWLKARLFGDFVFQERNEYLPHIGKYAMFNKDCRIKKGELVCQE